MSPKAIKNLTEKKYRQETGLFIVEGEKNIKELLVSSFKIVELLGTKQFLVVIQNEVSIYEQKMHKFPLFCTESSEAELVRMGTFMTNGAGIAVVEQKEMPTELTILETARQNIVLLLDDIRDPGNFGTIIRTADWFGVTHIVASPNTVDFYNPKVITTSMGSFTRMSVSYLDIETILKAASHAKIPIIATDINGKNIHEGGLPKNGFLVMGSESHGISNTSVQFATEVITIPQFGTAESLNVSVATGIILDALRRS